MVTSTPTPSQIGVPVTPTQYREVRSLAAKLDVTMAVVYRLAMRAAVDGRTFSAVSRDYLRTR